MSELQPKPIPTLEEGMRGAYQSKLDKDSGDYLEAYQKDRLRAFSHTLLQANKYAHILAKGGNDWHYGIRDQNGGVMNNGRVDINGRMIWYMNEMAFNFFVSEEVEGDPVMWNATRMVLDAIKQEEEKQLISKEQFNKIWRVNL